MERERGTLRKVHRGTLANEHSIGEGWCPGAYFVLYHKKLELDRKRACDGTYVVLYVVFERMARRNALDFCARVPGSDRLSFLMK